MAPTRLLTRHGRRPHGQKVPGDYVPVLSDQDALGAAGDPRRRRHDYEATLLRFSDRDCPCAKVEQRVLATPRLNKSPPLQQAQQAYGLMRRSKPPRISPRASRDNAAATRTAGVLAGHLLSDEM